MWLSEPRFSGMRGNPAILPRMRLASPCLSGMSIRPDGIPGVRHGQFPRVPDRHMRVTWMRSCIHGDFRVRGFHYFAHEV